MDDEIKKFEIKISENFLKANDENENDFQQSSLDFLESYKPEEIGELKKKFDEIIKNFDFKNEIKNICENIDYRQILIPVFKNKFFLLTDLAPVDSCYYRSIVEILFKKTKEEHQKITQEFKKRCDYQFDFNNKKAFFDKIKEIGPKNPNKICLILNISDFYPRIYLHRLENILRKYCETDFENDLVDALLKILQSINKKQSYGIPVGPKCSKDLAEIMLLTLDQDFLQICQRVTNFTDGLIFYRHSDTYLILFDEIKYAKTVLSEITNIFIKNNNFNFQSSKSEIIKFKHFLTKLKKKDESKKKIIDSLQSFKQSSFLQIHKDQENYIFKYINKIENYQLFEIIKDLEIENIDQLKNLYPYFSHYEFHILDLWFRMARKFLKENNGNANDLIKFVDEQSDIDYCFYKIMRDKLKIDFGDKYQFNKILIEEELASFYYPNYMVKKFEKFFEYETFFSKRYDYADWNIWLSTFGTKNG